MASQWNLWMWLECIVWLVGVVGRRFVKLGVWSAICVKTQNDAGIYNSCWYLRFMLVFTIHAGIYTSCWYRKYQYEV